MLNKIYVKVKDFIKDYYLWLLLYFVVVIVLTYKLPFYIYTGGGTIDIDSKIELKDETKSTGSYNMCYVSEINATIPTYLMSYLFKDWDLVSKEEVTLNNEETIEDVLLRDQLYLKQANQSAILTAYSYANFNYEVTDTHPYIIYVEDLKSTNLKIGDEIISIDEKEVSSLEEITTILEDKEVGDKLIIKVKENNEIKTKEATVKEEKGRKIIGISILIIYDYETSPEVEFHFSSSESGPSGGLMLSLALYDKLVEEDITKGLKIAGTGTIDEEGNVGSIGGVQYKLKGAVVSRADIFIVPNGENYEESIKLKEENNYNIKIIGVSTFEEAVDKLK